MTKQVKAIHLIKEKNLVERVENSFGAVENIDESTRVIKNICIMGRKESANNRVYSDKAIDSLVGFANGAKCYINHISKEEIKQRSGVRDLRDWAGVLENTYRKGDGVFADLKVRESYFDLFKDIATMKPQGIGHSIDARVKAFTDDKTGMESIVDIARLNSCDIVSSPAMTTNLFESTIEANLKSTPEIIFSQEYVEMKIEKLFKEVMIQEGIIQNKISADEISSMTYVVNDLLRIVLNEENLSIVDKKTKVMAIFDDLSKEIKTKLTSMKENRKMDITLDQLKLENADIVKAIVEEYKKDQDVVGMKSTLEQTQKWYDAVEADYKQLQNTITQKDKEIQYVTEACKEAEKQCGEAKVKLDDIEVLKKQNDKKTYIEAMVEQSKLSKDAKTEVFMEQLMKEDDEKVIQKIIDDRVNLLASNGKVKESGREFDISKLVGDDNKKVTESKEKLNEVTEAFIKSKKQR